MKKNFIVGVFILCACNLFAQRASDFRMDLSSDGRGVIITRYSGRGTHVVIPRESEGLPVVEIGRNVFKNTKAMVSVDIPETVRVIGESAFEGCQNLASIVLPENIISIGKDAFRGTGIQELVFPASLRNVNEGAFSQTQIRTVTIPDNVIFPSNARAMNIDNGGVFAGCRQLTEAVFTGTRTFIPGGMFANTNLSNIIFPTGLEIIESNAFLGCGNLREINLPDTVKILGDWSFSRSGITTINLPRDIVEIRTGCFGYSNLTTVNIPENVTRINFVGYNLGSPFVSTNLSRISRSRLEDVGL